MVLGTNQGTDIWSCWTKERRMVTASFWMKVWTSSLVQLAGITLLSTASKLVPVGAAVGAVGTAKSTAAL